MFVGTNFRATLYLQILQLKYKYVAMQTVAERCRCAPYVWV